MANKIYSQNGLLLGIPTGGSTQNLKAGDGITIDDNYISVDAHTEGNIEGNGTTDNPIKLKDIINLDEVHANTVVGVKGNFGDVLIGRSDKVSTFIEKVKELEANQHEYTGSEHIDVSDDYVISLKDDVALKSDIPSLDDYAKKSDLNEYVDKDELANYYTKDETYNQDQITALIQSIGYNAGSHISIDEDTKTISVVDLVGTTITSDNGTVTIVPSENEDGSMNYDLSVVPGGGSDVNILGSWPVYANNIGDGVWSIGADLHEWIKGQDVDEKLESYQKLLIAGDGINIENNVISSVETPYTGTSPIIVNGHNISFDDSLYAKKTDVASEEAARIAADADLLDKINAKPDSYVAGDNISIVDNTISVTGIVDKLHEYTGDQYISVDNVNDKITLNPAWVDWRTYWTEQSAIKGRATSLEGRMTAVETNKADKTDLNNYFTKSETYNKIAIDGMLTGKQDKLTAGDHISINGNVISAVGFQEPGDYATKAELAVETNARIAGDNALAEEIAEKQDPINAGAHIRIDDGITINAVGFAEQSDFEQAVDELHKDIEDINDEIDELNQNKQDKLTAGSNISIVDNVISATGLQPAGDYATKSELNNEKTAREQADSVLSDSKQDKLTAGSNISIVDNVISVTGELGKTYTGVAPITVNNTTNKISIDDSNYATKSDLNNYQPVGDYVTQQEFDSEVQARQNGDENLQTLVNNKQDQLTAGDGIKIENNVISVDSTTEDVWELVAGDNITIEKNEETEEVIISSTASSDVKITHSGRGGYRDNYNRLNFIDQYDEHAGQAITISRPDSETSSYLGYTLSSKDRDNLDNIYNYTNYNHVLNYSTATTKKDCYYLEPCSVIDGMISLYVSDATGPVSLMPLTISENGDYQSSVSSSWNWSKSSINANAYVTNSAGEYITIPFHWETTGEKYDKIGIKGVSGATIQRGQIIIHGKK